ncbi:hypothetical protein [Albidovulum sp.]
MNRRVFVIAAACCLTTAPAFAAAGDAEEIVRQQLAELGFTVTSRSRTWLGRVRLEAVRGPLHREVVINPASGEILRDYTERQVSARDGAGNSGAEAGGGTSEPEREGTEPERETQREPERGTESGGGAEPGPREREARRERGTVQ